MRFGLFSLFVGVVMLMSVAGAKAAEVLLLKDSFPDSSIMVYNNLKSAISGANISFEEVDMESLATRLDAETGPRCILLLPNAVHFPGNAKTALDAFLKRGNHLLALSGPAFSDIVTRINGKWVGRDDLMQELAKQTGTKVVDFGEQDLKTWARGAGTMTNKTVYEVVDSASPGVPKTLHVQVSKLDDWETFGSPNFEKPFPDGYSTTVFWAKGGPNTPELILEWVEKDGTRWMGVVKLTTLWKRYALTPSDFAFWVDKSPAGRGGDKDRFNPQNAVRLSVGVASGISKQQMGIAHEYWVAGIEAVKNSSDNVDFTPPTIESISPGYKVHNTQAGLVMLADGGTTLPFDGMVTASIQRNLGLGSDKLRSSRQIPLIYVLDSMGKRRGIGAHLFLNTEGAYKGSIFGYAGFAQADIEKTDSYGTSVLADVIRRMTRGLFLANAGSEHFAYVEGEPIKLGAYITNLGKSNAKVQVEFTISMDGKILNNTKVEIVAPVGPDAKPIYAQGRSPKLKEGEYTVRTTLSVDGMQVDEISHSMNVIKYHKLTDKEVITAKGSDFYLNGEKWYGLGMNYWPRYSIGQEPSEYWLHWLSPEQYDPQIIDEDLMLAKSLGMNLLSVSYGTEVQARPLMDFMARAKKYGIKINMYVPGLHPLWQDFPLANKLITAAHLSQSPAFFAYDMGWEVHVGPYEARKSFDWEWQKWVIDQYGSVDNAEKDWGYTAKRVDGTITGPTDDQLIKESDWRVYIAAYRRFWDDRFNKGYRTSRENVKTLDPVHLIGARSGWGGLGGEWPATQLPIDLASGIKHLDFLSPEGYNIGGDRRGFLKGGFDSAYARFVSRGKPIYWAEYGSPLFVGVLPVKYTPETGMDQESAEADYYRNFINMTYEVGANASAGWWWPGGLRVDEKSDYGVINPDGTPRSAAMEFTRIAKKYKTPHDSRKPDVVLTIDRDKYIPGYAGIYKESALAWADMYLDGKFPELKTDGTGTTSADTPLLAVGNKPYNKQNPLKYLNSEFNYLRVNGDPVANDGHIVVVSGKALYVEASLGNIGEASWLSPKSAGGVGGVYLVATSGDQRVEVPIKLDTPYLGDAVINRFLITKGIQKETTFTFRLLAKDRADFGEVYRIVLSPI